VSHYINFSALFFSHFSLRFPACVLSIVLLGVSYDQSDLVGQWRVYSYWDGDIKDAGFTRSIVVVDALGNITGQDIDSDGSTSPSTLEPAIQAIG